MEEKKRIGLLTLVIAIAGIVFAAIDAIVSVTYAVVPSKSSNNFFALVIDGPIWWRINPLIIITIISVGIIAFLLGGDGLRLSAYSIKRFFGFVRVCLTFVIISFSGLGDVISQTFTELYTGNPPLSWLYIDWWWTKFMPLPALIVFLFGQSVPSGIDMALASAIGIILLSLMWLQYYGKLSLGKIRNSLQASETKTSL
jgi:hypothetical protein